MSAVNELLRPGIYKRTQGRIARQLTFAALGVLSLVGAWRLSQHVLGSPWLHYGVPALIGVLGCWISYRVVNIPRFADFLIAVEAEMNKVSWPSGKELMRGSAVVLVTIFLLAALLTLYDFFWSVVLLKLLKIAG